MKDSLSNKTTYPIRYEYWKVDAGTRHNSSFLSIVGFIQLFFIKVALFSVFLFVSLTNLNQKIYIYTYIYIRTLYSSLKSSF